ncbi:hypothetical protein F511_41607 [Dorcoceras hygrometricum]|uniref:Uncharacterized protein n=1 Tax=Dorcoceras hygrometricum TaxID=472368 RepID=A0A2Z7BIT2_9LAMI|nr:hypothetical protein F511_41607 [Dorcoceras hygrometricum]
MQILHLYVETDSINPNLGYNEPDSYQHVFEGGFFNQPGDEFFDTNTADHEIELASPDQGDANTHVGFSDTEPEISSDESDEEPTNDEHEDNVHEGTSSVTSEEILYKDKSRHFSQCDATSWTRKVTKTKTRKLRNTACKIMDDDEDQGIQHSRSWTRTKMNTKTRSNTACKKSSGLEKLIKTIQQNFLSSTH